MDIKWICHSFEFMCLITFHILHIMDIEWICHSFEFMCLIYNFLFYNIILVQYYSLFTTLLPLSWTYNICNYYYCLLHMQISAQASITTSLVRTFCSRSLACTLGFLLRALFQSQSVSPNWNYDIYIQYFIHYYTLHFNIHITIYIFMVTLFLKHLKCTPTVTILIFLSTMIQSDFCYFICMYVCFYVHICWDI